MPSGWPARMGRCWSQRRGVGGAGSLTSRVMTKKIASVKLRSEPRTSDTWYRSADNTAANGIRFRDGNGKNYNPGDGNWGDWGSWVSCPTGSYIVGFRTYVVPHRGSGDDTALERVQFKCGKTTSWCIICPHDESSVSSNHSTWFIWTPPHFPIFHDQLSYHLFCRRWYMQSSK